MIFFGVGGIIGAGIFGIIGEALAQAGPSLPLSFLFVAACCALVGLAYCELATAIPVAGSCYTYCYVYFGELAAVLMGWNAVLEYMVGASVVARAWAAYLASFVETAGGHLPDELVRARPAAAAAAAAAATARPTAQSSSSSTRRRARWWCWRRRSAASASTSRRA